MSATAQNFAYIYGKKKENAKENVISKEKLENAIRMAEKLMSSVRRCT